MMEKKLYLVETISMFRMRYVVEAREEEHANDEVVMGLGRENFNEFSQKHIDEVIVSSREISTDEFLKEFDKDNDYLSKWSIAEKMRNINTINYEEDSSNR